MLPGFHLHTDKDEDGIKNITNKKVWSDPTFLETRSEKGLLNSTMLQCDSMTPAERDNDEMAKYMLDHLKDKIESKGFKVFAIYKYTTRTKKIEDKIEEPIKFFLEAWHPENKNVVGLVPGAKKY